MSITYYILGIGFFIFITIVCIINVQHYSDLLYHSEVDNTGDKYTGISPTLLNVLMIVNIIVATLSIGMICFCFVTLIKGEPKPVMQIDLDENLAGAIIEDVIGKQYFKETNKGKSPDDALEAASKYATHELMVSLYNDGASNLEAQAKAKKLIIDYINKKYPSGKFEMSKKFVYNEEYESLKLYIEEKFKIYDKNINELNSSNSPNIIPEQIKDVIAFNKKRKEELISKLKEFEDKKIIIGKPVSVIKGAIDADITVFDKIKGFFVKPAEGVI
jgi:hypothetical protein